MDVPRQTATGTTEDLGGSGTLVLRLARENLRWVYLRIQGELKKVGVSISAIAICSLLHRHGLPPAPRRDGPSWREFLTQQAAGIVACDLFCVETVRLRTLYVLFLIELSTRRGCTWLVSPPIPVLAA